MVERVERFAPELQALCFSQLEILHCGEVDVPRRWSHQRITSGGSERSGRSRSERRGVEPSGQRSILGRQIWIHAGCIQTIEFRHNNLTGSIPANQIEWASVLI